MLKIVIRNLQNKVPLNSQGIKRTILKTISSEKVKKSGEITLSFVNDQEIKGLNLRYRGQNNPTDVLAFDISRPSDPKNIFADIVISTDTAIRNACIFKTSKLYELHLYLIHGLLHLLGYDDKTQRQRKIMDEKAAYILTALKLRNNNRQARYVHS